MPRWCIAMAELNHTQQIELLSIAREAIAGELRGEPFSVNSAEGDDWLQQPAACFVTLKIKETLRGCVGCMEAVKPLGQTVVEYAIAAAFHDRRFSPLSSAQLALVHIEVSLLSPILPMNIEDEADLLQQLRPDIDGLLLEFGPYRATFLPQVWQQPPDSDTFLAHLKQKAGLEEDFWDDEMQFFHYTVSHFSEVGP